MSLDVYGEEYNKGYGGCLLVVLWLASGPTAYATLQSLREAFQTGLIEGSYRGNDWSFVQSADPTGFQIAFASVSILFLISLAFFLYGLYKIIRFFTASPLS